MPARDPQTLARRLERLQAVQVEVSVELARVRTTLRDLLELRPGATLPLNRLAGEAVHVYAAGRPLARGEAVFVGDVLGVRVTDVIAAAPTPKPSCRSKRSHPPESGEFGP